MGVGSLAETHLEAVDWKVGEEAAGPVASHFYGLKLVVQVLLRFLALAELERSNPTPGEIMFLREIYKI